MPKCDTKNCEREATTKIKKCTRCYHYIWRWMKAGPSKANKHMARLMRREELLDSAMGSNVRTLVRRRA